MRIVIDTNVLISAVFFGGYEYEEIVQEMIDRKQGHINRTIPCPAICR